MQRPISRRAWLAAWLVASGWLAGCRQEPPRSDPAPTTASVPGWFEDFTGPSGIAFVHEVETSGHYLFSESIGSGGAFLDFDNDGRLDVYLIHNVAPSAPAMGAPAVGAPAVGAPAGSASATNRLFHQQPDGRFQDVSAGSGLDVTGHGNGLAVGDVNNDGLPEVLMTEYDRIRLFLNLGGGKFKDVTAAAGLTNRHWSVPAAFVDYDRDGWLDLVVGNYLDFDPTQRCPDAKGQPDFCGPHGFRSTITRLFHNRGAKAGAGPRFEDVTVSSGFARAPGKAMQIVGADFDGDHWPDVFITDDGLPNRLFVNQRDGTFKEEAVTRGLAHTGMGATAANMGIALGDVDNDGLFDLFVPHLTEESHTLWRQGPRGLFQDHTARAGLLGLTWHGTGFGAVLADFDCDGAPDLAVANGLVRRSADRRSLGQVAPKLASAIAPFWKPYAEPSQLFANDGLGRFREISATNPSLCGEALVGRGLVCGDLDNDGALDLLVTGIAGPARVLRNVVSPRGHWLGLRALDPVLGGRDAYGAEITIRAGGRSWWRLVQPAYSYASSNDPRVHCGLGDVAVVDEILVRWPDGVEERFAGGAANRYQTLRRASGSYTRR